MSIERARYDWKDLCNKFNKWIVKDPFTLPFKNIDPEGDTTKELLGNWEPFILRLCEASQQSDHPEKTLAISTLQNFYHSGLYQSDKKEKIIPEKAIQDIKANYSTKKKIRERILAHNLSWRTERLTNEIQSERVRSKESQLHYLINDIIYFTEKFNHLVATKQKFANADVAHLTDFLEHFNDKIINPLLNKNSSFSSSTSKFYNRFIASSYQLFGIPSDDLIILDLKPDDLNAQKRLFNIFSSRFTFFSILNKFHQEYTENSNKFISLTYICYSTLFSQIENDILIPLYQRYDEVLKKNKKDKENFKATIDGIAAALMNAREKNNVTPDELQKEIKRIINVNLIENNDQLAKSDRSGCQKFGRILLNILTHIFFPFAIKKYLKCGHSYFRIFSSKSQDIAKQVAKNANAIANGQIIEPANENQKKFLQHKMYQRTS